MIASLHKISRVMLVSFALVALALGYWGFIRREELLAREQNPRLVLEEQRIRRGQILDRNEVVLAATLTDPDTGLSSRRYPYPGAAPVVGYYSIRHGVGGIEAQYDSLLRGDIYLSTPQRIAGQALHRPQVGGDVRLTLDYRIQQMAHDLLAGRRGGVVVINSPGGDVLAMASQPTFDASMLDDNWDRLSRDPNAPLVNRVTQGLYQPGTILQSVILGAALDTRTTLSSTAWGGSLSVPVDSSLLPCAADPARVRSIENAFLWACPAPFQRLGRQIGARQLDAILSSFGLLEAPTFTLPTEAADLENPPAQSELALTAIGQGSLTVTPLQMAQVAAALANHGEMPALRLVEAVRPPGGEWENVAPEGHPRGTISRASADSTSRLMRQAVTQGAAREAFLARQPVYGHVGLAVVGPQATLNAWFIGFVSRDDGQSIAVAVLLEDEPDAATAAQIGAQILATALEAAP